MTASKVILWRHGQTDLNVSGRIQGSSDVPLNEVGVEQARAAAGVLAGYQPALIVSSPLSRAFATAEALGAVAGVQVERDERLIERFFGVWEGKNGQEIEAVYPEQYNDWRTGRDPQGLDIETRRSVGERVREAVEEWAEKTDGVLVIVAHGAALKCGTTSLLGEDPSEWAGLRVMSNCHWTVIDHQAGYVPEWRILEYNSGDPKAGEVITPH